jgi:hypothetical protein
MLRLRSLSLAAALALTACVVPPSATQRLAQAANDLNTAARFGRMDIALELVKDSAREDFSKRHAAWGRAVRIVDYDFGGMAMRKNGDADVTITISWQRPDETTMRTTDISQRWTDKLGGWIMISEEERGGDRGLLAEITKGKGQNAGAEIVEEVAPPASTGVSPSLRSRYQTRTIYEQ